MFRNKITKSLDFLSKYFPTLQNIAFFSRQRVHFFGAQYTIFGIFAVASFIIPYFMWSEANNLVIMNQDIAIILRFIAGILVFGLIVNDLFPSSIKPYLPLYWHFTLLYCLPFMTTFLFLYNGGSTDWFINVALALFLLAILTDWLSFMVLLSIGVSCGYLLYSILLDAEMATNIFNDEYKLHLFLYISFFTILIGMLFSRNKEVQQQQLISLLDQQISERTSELENAILIKKDFIDKINNEINSPVKNILNLATMLFFKKENLTNNQSKELLIQLYNSAEKLYYLISNILDISKFENGNINLNIENVNLAEIAKEAIFESEALRKEKKLSINLKIDTKNLEVECDRFKIKQVLKNLISNAINFSKEGNILLNIKDTKSRHEDGTIIEMVEISIIDEGIGIAEDQIEFIFKLLNKSSNNFNKDNTSERGLSLSVSKKIIKAHFGKIWAQNNFNHGATFTFTIPHKLI